jgi:dTDP-4-amino-4,6-dideoxygalactose transaminase
MTTSTIVKTEPLLPQEWPGSYYIGDEEMDAVNRVLMARSPFRFYGHDVQRYAERVEGIFRERLDRKHAILINSGTGALSVAMAAADVGPGDEVLLPGFLWVACLASIVRAGGVPRLVDIDDTFTMDPDDLERKITPRTKAVLCVHMSGTSGDIERIREICTRRNVLLIEDVAQSNGATFKGKPLGSFGDLSMFSFQYNKNITSGEGGLVTMNDDLLFQRAWAYHDLGYGRDANGRLDPFGAVQSWGFGVRMSEVTAAVLYGQLQKIDTIIGSMRARNRQLYEGLGRIPGVKTRRRIDPDGDSGPFVIITLPDAELTKQIVKKTRAAGVRPGPWGFGNIRMTDFYFHIYHHNISLVERKGVNSSGHPWTDPRNDFARDYNYRQGELPQLDDLVERSILIPVAPVLTPEACDRVIEIYTEAAAELGLQ